MATIAKYHPHAGAALYDTEAHAYILGDDGKPVKADRATGEAVTDRDYTPRTTRIGTLTMKVDRAGTVTVQDSATAFPPIELVRSGKARAIYAAVTRAVARLGHPDVEVKEGE